MKKFLLRIILLIPQLHCFSQTYIDSGNVSGTWTKENSPYHIQGNIYVQENQKLTIEPGVKVIFHGHYRIQLDHASILAVGSPEDSILFTAADTNGFVNGDWNEGAWYGINLSYPPSTGDSSHFAYCRFEFAKIPGDKYQKGMGVIGIEWIPRMEIRDCLFENNRTEQEGIIDIHFSDLVIRNNLFIHNVSGEIISMNQDSPEICHNRFDSNDCEVLLWITDWNHPEIHHNLFIHNTTNSVILTQGNCRPRFYQNRILNNRGNVIACEKSKAQFINNLLANNETHTLDLSDDESVFVHNTIVNHNGPAPVVLLSGSHNLFLGNIFNGNDTYIYYESGGQEPSFRYNLFDFDTSFWSGEEFKGIYEQNQENSSPHFVINTGGTGPDFDAEFADFNIAPHAHIVNQGDPDIPEEYLFPDLYDRERIRYGRIDYGAYEADDDHKTIPLILERDTVLIADTIHVLQSFIIPDDVTLKLCARAVVLFQGPDSIFVKGSLEAIGTEDEPIRFTLADTNGFAGSDEGAGGWRGIIMDNSDGSMDDNPASVFEHCLFEYVKVPYQGIENPGRGGVFTLRFVDGLVLNHSLFRNNFAARQGHAIYGWESDFDIEYCEFYNHLEKDEYTRGTIHLTGSRNRLDHCTFHDNRTYEGASLYAFNCELVLSNSRFYNNDVIHPGIASVLDSYGSDVHMYNCLVHNNLSCNDAVIRLQSSRVTIDNSTVAHNLMTGLGGAYAAGISLSRTELTLRNSILHGNINDQDSCSIMLLEDSSDPNLYNTLIQGGIKGIKTHPGFSYTGEFVDCIEGDPFFISPPPNSGLVDTALETDWRLLDVSPCINAGTEDTVGLNLPVYDLDGIERILDSRIDMGAYEKSGNPPEVSKQPVGGNFCAGDSVMLSIDYVQTDSALLQWQKDGTDIPGANAKIFTIHSARQDHTGNYACRMVNSFGQAYTLPVFISIKDPPVILTQPADAWVEPGKPISLKVQLSGSQPMDIDWKLDNGDLDVHLPEYTFTPVDSSQEGSYSCVISNACGTVSTEPASIFLAPQICMVTVSTTTGYNMVIWEKKNRSPIMAYNIYRESTAAGIYDKLATLPYGDLSLYTDTVADPTAQAYIYKITALDTAGTETDADLCKPHKTIHLLVSTNPELNTTQLEWDNYYGFEYVTCKIFRSSTGANLEEIHSLSSNFNSWTDPEPLTGNQYYRIAVEKPQPCEPEGGEMKAGTGTYYHSLSNMDDNKLQEGQYPPDSIILSHQSIEEECLPGTMIGKLSTEDPDTNDVHYYQLIPGEGSDDNDAFTLSGELLLSARSFDYETKTTCSIRIRSTDAAGKFREEIFTIQIIDINEATGLPEYAQGGIRIFPNPLQGEACIVFPEPYTEPYRMVITDLSGKKVMIRENIRSGSFWIYPGRLEKGIYILELRGERIYRDRIMVE